MVDVQREVVGQWKVGAQTFAGGSQPRTELPELSGPRLVFALPKEACPGTGEVVNETYSIELRVAARLENLVFLQLGAEIFPFVLVDVRGQYDLVVDENARI
ncbi:hypothetical protein [Bradyrhizobium sp. 177]|uniref:hypothetical protein n=1 Tax=Bradyrhizobium sp. 177 TaxID=2782647 RepID=UPI003211B91F